MPIAQYRHHGCRITDELKYKGMRTLFLENNLIKIGVLVDKGVDIFQFIHKASDTNFLWQSPLGIVDPHKSTPTIPNSSGVFLDTYHGGWQEIFPGGGPVNYRGADLGLHGEVCHLGWDYDIITDNEEEIAVKFSVNCIRTPFRLEKTLRMVIDNPTLFIEEKVTNLSPDSQDFMWGHHPAFGAPFLKEGLKLIIPAKTGIVHTPKFAPTGLLEPGKEFAWPTIQAEEKMVNLSTVPGPDAGFSELLYLKDLTDGWYAVLDEDKKIGIGFSWDLRVFPYLWFWCVYGKFPGYPWWDRVYCIALEPWTSIPNNLNDAIRTNRQFTIKGGDSITTKLQATAIQGKSTINAIRSDGKVI